MDGESCSATLTPSVLRGRSDARGARAAAPLDLHEGISPPGGCARWPEHLRLLNRTSGELVRGRCRATNLCRYCQRLYVVETVEMLTLDALEWPPTLWAVLTAREHLTRRDTYRHLEHLRRACLRRWPDVEWFVQVEFQKRGALHLNLLVKGVPVDQEDELRQVLVDVWCSRVDARPVGQWVGTVEEAGGVVRYLAKELAHGLKREQAAPIGWKGHRTSQTRGYLVRPASVMRQEAREALRTKRELWKLQDAHPDAPADVIEDYLADREAAAAEDVWTLTHTPGHAPMQPDHARQMREAAAAPFLTLRRRRDAHRTGRRDEKPAQRGTPGDGGEVSRALPARAGSPAAAPPPLVA